jgi:LysM repeat protein
MPLFNKKPTEQGEIAPETRANPVWLVAATWLLALTMMAVLGFALYQFFSGRSLLAYIRGVGSSPAVTAAPNTLPDYNPSSRFNSLARSTDPETVIQEGARKSVAEIQVESGDTLFGLAENYSLEPESILWANFGVLQDNPHLISTGVTLKIPPVDGILYQWKDGDKLDHIAGLYKVDVDDILLYPGNNLDITNPVIEPGTYIMIPGGYR